MKNFKAQNEVLFNTDSNGGLLPSDLWSPISDQMVSDGLVEDCVLEGIAWQRLTQKGLELRMSFYGR